jgi:outer membrane biogenesis lipoprotein LolB
LAARVVSGFAVILLIGCAGQTPPAKVAEIEQQHLSFIRDGL